mmetsp:Transcript_24395/g.70215  ORF Transcript_24395/g.70215 Transcript_24395/m.70215 type:complete len:205 (+) Transcript_24395:1040-1654(+)
MGDSMPNKARDRSGSSVTPFSSRNASKASLADVPALRVGTSSNSFPTLALVISSVQTTRSPSASFPSASVAGRSTTMYGPFFIISWATYSTPFFLQSALRGFFLSPWIHAAPRSILAPVPPMSSVYVRPPMRGRASRILTLVQPALVSALAAERPDRPDPTTTTRLERSGVSLLRFNTFSRMPIVADPGCASGKGRIMRWVYDV